MNLMEGIVTAEDFEKVHGSHLEKLLAAGDYGSMRAIFKAALLEAAELKDSLAKELIGGLILSTALQTQADSIFLQDQMKKHNVTEAERNALVTDIVAILDRKKS